MADSPYVIVPKEPSAEMIRAVVPMYKAMIDGSEYPFTKNIYRAMLSASPSPITLEEIVEVLRFYANSENHRERRIDVARDEDGCNPTVAINNTRADTGYALSKVVMDEGSRARSLLFRLASMEETTDETDNGVEK